MSTTDGLDASRPLGHGVTLISSRSIPTPAKIPWHQLGHRIAMASKLSIQQQPQALTVFGP